MTEEQKKLKRYVSGIERSLRLPLKTKARINHDLATEIQLLREQGMTAEEIIAQMGSPEEVADRFNEEMVAGASPKPGLFLGSGIFGFAAAGTCLELLPLWNPGLTFPPAWICALNALVLAGTARTALRRLRERKGIIRK